MEATFTAARLEDALALVKKALGGDALIVSSERLEADGKWQVRASLAVGKAELTSLPVPTVPAGPPSKGMLERVLERNDVPEAILRDLVAHAGASPRSLREAQQAIERALKVTVAFAGPQRQRVVALVGPTGVGKTTSIAKLAAREALIERRRVVLVSTDDYRVGGSEQLARYAELIGARFEIATDASSLARVVGRHAAANRIWIDTAGRSPRDRIALASMADLLSGAGEPVAVQLCLPASMRAGELEQTVDRHAVLRPSALGITKLDEATSFGGPVAAAIRSRLPLAFFTTGQRVPEDIEAASAARLAAALCGEEVGS